jgi:uncharacterized protein YnzC (UPF0291/DUF896 family)
LTARERAVEIAKKRIEKYNDYAMKKIKNEKLAEQEAKNREITKEHKLGKIKEKVTTIKKLQNEEAKEIQVAGIQSYKRHLKDLNED